MKTQLIKAKYTQKKPTSWKDIHFGSIFTDYVLQMKFDISTGWDSPVILSQDESERLTSKAKVLHYGQGVFEGFKCYRRTDGTIGIFRLDSHLQRLNKSAARLAMPGISANVVKQALCDLIKQEMEWIPPVGEGALYIRPVLFASSASMGVGGSNQYLFNVMLSPATGYYSNSADGTRIKVEETMSRASRGGTGCIKAIGNYAGSLLSSTLAKEEGFDQVIWLDPVEKKYIEEVGTMNIFFVINNSLVTPPLTDSIMPGITRDSIINIAKKMGMAVSETAVTMDDILEANQNGTLSEVFGSGTAVSISPVKEIYWKNQSIKPTHSYFGPVSGHLKEVITSIHTTPETFGFAEWLTIIE
ncbi:branched-chain amino acid aminotransferase [Acerihabitans sp. KWT182]|uniref:Branched-chain-amino-acid aminotransferase n=1 Tax=Acerihabitans sp. KWT182 TaxID=3157919 RepID=A0AAU7Q9Q1_9GAMM